MSARSLPEKFLVAFSLAGEQRDFVRSIAETVEKELGRGTVFFDEWFESYLSGDNGDLKLLEIYGRNCDLAVYCISGPYNSKPWTKVEHAAIRARQMKASASTDKQEEMSVFPVRVGDGEVEGILYNTIAPDLRGRSFAECAELIINRLRLVLPGLKLGSSGTLAIPAWPENPPVLSWPMADHSVAREAFAELLSVKARWRFLPIRGVSETGKSHISRQMLANALALPDIACGRFDFKGTTGMDAEISAFIPDLGVASPPANPSLHQRLSHILGALKEKAHPTLLIFDTYEMAGETQDWVEKILLPCLIRASWLRVVITGQTVPTAMGAVSTARATVQLVRPEPTDWYDFGKQHRPDLTLAEVETVCRLSSHKATLMAQLLGPAL